MADQEYNEIVIGFVKKRDGQLLTVKLMELFKQVLKADFLNNEINLNGEVCVLDSFRKVIVNTTLGLRLIFEGGAGSIIVNGVEYTNDCSVMCKADDTASIRVQVSSGSIGSITNENGDTIVHNHGEFSLVMEKDHLVRVVFIH